jgi:hypothetical protein
VCSIAPITRGICRFICRVLCPGVVYCGADVGEVKGRCQSASAKVESGCPEEPRRAERIQNQITLCPPTTISRPDMAPSLKAALLGAAGGKALLMSASRLPLLEIQAPVRCITGDHTPLSIRWGVSGTTPSDARSCSSHILEIILVCPVTAPSVKRSSVSRPHDCLD